MKNGALGLWIFLALAFLGCSREIPVLGELPPFQLTDQDNQTLRLSDLKGKVWVANFVFTSCAGTCPMLTQRMTRVQDRLLEMGNGRPDLPVKIVSFSVDPERDSPEKLAEYAKRFGAKAGFWYFLTGPMQQVEGTVVQGFKMAMGKVDVGEAFDVVHGERFVLVDAEGRIRGYYRSEDGQELRRLFNDLKTLLDGRAG